MNDLIKVKLKKNIFNIPIFLAENIEKFRILELDKFIQLNTPVEKEERHVLLRTLKLLPENKLEYDIDGNITINFDIDMIPLDYEYDFNLSCYDPFQSYEILLVKNKKKHKNAEYEIDYDRDITKPNAFYNFHNANAPLSSWDLLLSNLANHINDVIDLANSDNECSKNSYIKYRNYDSRDPRNKLIDNLSQYGIFIILINRNIFMLIK